MLFSGNTRVYLVLGRTDMRKAINGLSAIIAGHVGLDPLSGHLFVFCNRHKDILKVLYWDQNGFCLWTKRLEKGRFRWPSDAGEVLELGNRELAWLLSGLSIKQAQAHKSLHYSQVF